MWVCGCTYTCVHKCVGCGLSGGVGYGMGVGVVEVEVYVCVCMHVIYNSMYVTVYKVHLSPSLQNIYICMVRPDQSSEFWFGLTRARNYESGCRIVFM